MYRGHSANQAELSRFGAYKAGDLLIWAGLADLLSRESGQARSEWEKKILHDAIVIVILIGFSLFAIFHRVIEHPFYWLQW